MRQHSHPMAYTYTTALYFGPASFNALMEFLHLPSQWFFNGISSSFLSMDFQCMGYHTEKSLQAWLESLKSKYETTTEGRQGIVSILNGTGCNSCKEKDSRVNRWLLLSNVVWQKPGCYVLENTRIPAMPSIEAVCVLRFEA